MIVPLALVASNRFTLVGAQGVGAPAVQVQLGRWRPLVHEEHLPHGDVVPPGAESLAGEHVGMSFHIMTFSTPSLALILRRLTVRMESLMLFSKTGLPSSLLA